MNIQMSYKLKGGNVWIRIFSLLFPNLLVFISLCPFEMWCWRRMEKIKWSEKVINEHVLDCIGEKRTLLNNILRRLDRSYSEKKLPPS